MTTSIPLHFDSQIAEAPCIILPYKNFTETQLYMIYEHEFIHIQNKDIPWRLFGLITSWIHWFNPLIFHRFKKCIVYKKWYVIILYYPISGCEKNLHQKIYRRMIYYLAIHHFTPKEYAVFMAELSNNTIFYSGTPHSQKTKVN